MTILFVLALIAGVVYLVSRLKPGTPEDDLAYDDEDAEFAEFAEFAENASAVVVEAGDGTRRVEPLYADPMRSAPDGWVAVARGMRAAEAEVVRGLLDSNVIRVAVDAAGPHLAHQAGQPPGAATSFTLSVAPEDADVARDLLNC